MPAKAANRKASAASSAKRPPPKKLAAKVTSKASPKPREAVLLPAGEPQEGSTFPIEIDPKKVEETLAKVGEELRHWANKGRYTKVRFKFRGKQLLPDLPLAAVVAAEGLTFYWGGILRALVFNVAGKTVFDVEFVNDSEKRVQLGREALLGGDIEKALSQFREAIDMDRDSASAHLNLGVALKLSGDRPSAKRAIERAKALSKDTPLEAEADRLLSTLQDV